jgi:hypothetical protein
MQHATSAKLRQLLTGTWTESVVHCHVNTHVVKSCDVLVLCKELCWALLLQLAFDHAATAPTPLPAAILHACQNTCCLLIKQHIQTVSCTCYTYEFALTSQCAEYAVNCCDRSNRQLQIFNRVAGNKSVAQAKRLARELLYCERKLQTCVYALRCAASETQAAWLYDRQQQLEGAAVARVDKFPAMQLSRTRILSYELLHPRCPIACLYVDHALHPSRHSMGALWVVPMSTETLPFRT